MEQHEQDSAEVRPGRPDASSAAASADHESRAGAESSPDVLHIIADIEQQLERVRTYQQTHDEQVKTLAERAGAIESTRAELERLAADLQQREARVSAEAAQLKALDASLRALGEQVAGDQSAIAAEVEAVAAREQAVHARQSELDAASARWEAERSAAAQERTAMESRVRHAERNVGELIQQVESMRAEAEQAAAESRVVREESAAARQAAEQAARQRDEAERRVEAAGAECESLRAALAEREAHLADSRRKLDTAGAKLSQFAKVLSEQTVKLERHAAAISEIEQQRQQIRRLEEQLAASALASDPTELERKDRRIAELTEALREARGQSAAAPDLAAKDQRIADLTAELEAHRVETGAAALEVARLMGELQALREQASVVSTDDSRVQALEARIAELEAALADASSSAAGGDVAAEHARVADALKDKADRIKLAARHLVQRRDRLRRVREALRERESRHVSASPPISEAVNAAHAEHEKLMRQAAQIQQQREELRQVQAMLAHSEGEMVRKWARPRAVITLVAGLLATIILAVASWLAADHFFPARIAAVVTLEAAPKPGTELTASEAAQWQSWHRNLVANESFHAALGQRLESRRVPGYDEPALVAARIQADLTLDSTQDDRLTLTLAGNDEAEAAAFLDALAATMVAESGRHVGKRSDGAKAVILGERRSAGQVRLASINPEPIIDQRLRYAGIILAGSMLLSFVLVIFIYRKLAHAKRLFEEDDSGLGAQGSEKPVAIR